MVRLGFWQVFFAIFVVLWAMIYAAPNLFERAGFEQWRADIATNAPGWVPDVFINMIPAQQIQRGLDLQGGLYMQLEVEWEVLLEERLTALADRLRTEFRQLGVRTSQPVGMRMDGEEAVVQNTLEFRLHEDEQLAIVENLLAEIDPQLLLDYQADSQIVRISYSDTALQEIQETAIERSLIIVRQRIDAFGTREPDIQRQGADRILLQLPGVENDEEVRDLLGRTAKMTFQFVDESVNPTAVVARTQRLPPGTDLLPSREVDENGDPLSHYVLRSRVIVGGENLNDAYPTFDENGRPAIGFEFDAEGASAFSQATRDNVGRRFAIVLDGRVVSAPEIISHIPNGRGIITGQNFTIEEVNESAIVLRSGALPAPMTILAGRQVDAKLGAENIIAGQVAVGIALIAVMIFMAVTYGLFGMLANAALLVNVVLILAILSAFGVTLTLPGIAGIVLTVGMAVDANVLIFERIREEMQKDKPPLAVVDASYRAAFRTILDSNITTLIAASLLFFIGAGPIKGFGVTLCVGIVSSIFSAVMITRLLVVPIVRRHKKRAIPLN